MYQIYRERSTATTVNSGGSDKGTSSDGSGDGKESGTTSEKGKDDKSGSGAGEKSGTGGDEAAKDSEKVWEEWVDIRLSTLPNDLANKKIIAQYLKIHP